MNALLHSENDRVSTEKEEQMDPPKEHLEEQMELQDRITSLDEVKALIIQEADDLTGGHTHPEDRVNKDEMESKDPPDLVPPHPSHCRGRKRHRGGRNRHNRVRVTARNRKALPETSQDSHFHGSLRKTCRIKVLLPALSNYPPPVVDGCGERAKGRRQEVC